MPVKLQKPLPVSNKAIVIKSGSEESYEVIDTTTDKGKITVFNPVIDKISITYNPPIEDGIVAIPEALMDLAKDKGAPEFQSASSGNKAAKTPKYGISVNLLPTGSTEGVLIQARGLNFWKAAEATGHEPSPALMRFEFNPTKLKPFGMAFFKNAIQQFSLKTFSYADILAHGRATRVDIAIDIIGIAPHELIATFYDLAKSSVYLGLNGRVETSYFGQKMTKTGKLQPSKLSVYNKQQEAIDKGNAPMFPGIPHTRVEFRVKANKAPADLHKLHLPFDSLSLFSPSLIPPPNPTYVWMLFLEAVRLRGKEKALSYLPPHERAKFATALESAKDLIWRTPLLRKNWSKQIATAIDP